MSSASRLTIMVSVTGCDLRPRQIPLSSPYTVGISVTRGVPGGFLMCKRFCKKNSWGRGKWEGFGCPPPSRKFKNCKLMCNRLRTLRIRRYAPGYCAVLLCSRLLATTVGCTLYTSCRPISFMYTYQLRPYREKYTVHWKLRKHLSAIIIA